MTTKLQTKTDKRIEKLADKGLVDEQRIRLLAIAFNIPYITRGGNYQGYCILPADLDELETLLKRHYRK